MRLGFFLPHIGPWAGPDSLTQVARGAEDIGYDSLWVTERSLVPRQKRDLGAQPREFDRASPADPLAAPGDQRPHSGQRSHRSPRRHIAHEGTGETTAETDRRASGLVRSGETDDDVGDRARGEPDERRTAG